MVSLYELIWPELHNTVLYYIKPDECGRVCVHELYDCVYISVCICDASAIDIS